MFRHSQKLRFDLSPRDLSTVTEDRVPIVAQGEYTVYPGGGQAHSDATVLTQTFKLKGG